MQRCEGGDSLGDAVDRLRRGWGGEEDSGAEQSGEVLRMHFESVAR